MATIAQAEERMLELLGYPNRSRPNRHQRLTWLNLAIDDLAKEAESSTKPHLVEKFSLQVVAGTNEYVVPVDDFSSLYYVVSDPDAFPEETQREIEVINFPDSNLYVGTSGIREGESKVVKMGWRGFGDDRRLITFPTNASDQLICWYNRKAPDEPSVSDQVFTQDSFQLSLVPAAAALMGMAEWTWEGMLPQEEDIKKQWLLDKSNPMSLLNYYNKQYHHYVQRTQRPNTAHPSAKLQGHASRRRIRRRFHRHF
jgi:hypothetical protein